MSETEITTAPLSEEALAIMDRAVREAREKGWCMEFTNIAGKVFGIPSKDVVDSDGLDCLGYSREGFNTEGYDREGYNKDGFNYYGFNRNGFDKDGFDRNGLNEDGFDKDGRDKYHFDYHGYDQEGYDKYGDRRNASREWYARQAAKPEGEFRFDRHKNERPLDRIMMEKIVF